MSFNSLCYQQPFGKIHSSFLPSALLLFSPLSYKTSDSGLVAGWGNPPQCTHVLTLCISIYTIRGCTALPAGSSHGFQLWQQMCWQAGELGRERRPALCHTRVWWGTVRRGWDVGKPRLAGTRLCVQHLHPAFGRGEVLQTPTGWPSSWGHSHRGHPAVPSAFLSLFSFLFFQFLTFPNVTAPAPGASDTATAGVVFFKKGGKNWTRVPCFCTWRGFARLKRAKYVLY